MLPEAWNVEHNNLHHYRLGESGDPDLVERNLDILRTFPVPTTLKYSVVALLAAVWKWYYYAPNTFKQLKIQEMKKVGGTPVRRIDGNINARAANTQRTRSPPHPHTHTPSLTHSHPR